MEKTQLLNTILSYSTTKKQKIKSINQLANYEGISIELLALLKIYLKNNENLSTFIRKIDLSGRQEH